jgi:DNA-binding SARP family transcriptional activator
VLYCRRGDQMAGRPWREKIMECCVLGPLSLRVRGAVITPTAPKPRQVLALLLMYANQVVSVPALIRELWNEHPPRSAQSTMQTYVLQLRKLLVAGLQLPASRISSDLLVTRVGGYQLRVEPDSLDMFRFERLTRAGRAALGAENYQLAAATLHEALRLWRDEPLVDVPAGPLLQAQLVRLEETRLTAVEGRIEAELRLGLHRELLPELAYLAAKYPLHENLHAQQMVALYWCGRRCEALEVFHRLRARLVEDFGLEPTDRMQQMQQAILNADVLPVGGGATPLGTAALGTTALGTSPLGTSPLGTSPLGVAPLIAS